MNLGWYMPPLPICTRNITTPIYKMTVGGYQNGMDVCVVGFHPPPPIAEFGNQPPLDRLSFAFRCWGLNTS